VASDELELVRRCRIGDQEACRALVELYARMVGSVIWKATGDRAAIEDLAQETFLRVFRGLEYFDARGRLSTWIYTIAHRVAIDHFRKTVRGNEQETDSDVMHELPAPTPSPEADLLSNETQALIREGLARLPEKYRLAILYTAIEGLDYSTVAVMLDVPVGTLKTFVFRGKQMLKEYMVKNSNAL
jgi:RNA polymerase sigma-70 factor (ECF subfamily)